MVLTLAEQQRFEGLEYEIVQLKDEVNRYKFQGSQGWVGNQTIQSGYLQSSNFAQSSSGFRLTADGIIYAVGAVISGSITATSGTIGGFTIGADYISDAADSFGLASTVSGSDDVRFWAGDTFANRATADFRVTEAGAVTASSITITGGSIAGTPINTIPNSTATDISLLDMTHDLVFSVTDLNTVAWASGTITLSNGRTFSITGSNTGNMAARTYVYLDTAVSTTALQTTTTVSTAMGANKKLIAVCQNQTAEASFDVYGGIGGMKLPESSTSISNNNWTYSGTWSVTDLNTIAWGSGTLTTSNGGSYSITGSNTGNMAAKTYIYFALGTSSTAFQTTTTASTAIGAGKILIAIAQNGTAEANYMVMNDKQHNIDAANIVAGSITANEISTGTITADRMSVSQLSAIAADMGAITAGTITLPSGGHIKSGQTAYDTGTGFYLGNDSGTTKFSIGNSSNLTWDGSALKVGSWTVTDLTLHTDDQGIVLNNFINAITVGGGGTEGSIRVGAATAPTTGTGIFMGFDGGTNYDFRAGDPAGTYIHWDGSAATLTANGGTIQTGTSGNRFVMSPTVFQGYDASSNVVFEVLLTGGNAADVIMGDDASGSYAQWDDSAGTFNVYADNVPTTTQGFFGGDGSEADPNISAGTTTYSFGSANVLIKNFASLTVTGTAKIAFSNPATDGSIAILKSQGNTTITSNSSSVIDLTSMGATGGTAGLIGTTPLNISVSTGLGGVEGGDTGSGNGGAGGTTLTTIQQQLYINAEYKLFRRFVNIMPGAGGGGGENGNVGAGGTGGRGAGSLIIECGGAFNFTTGTMALNGATGQAGQGGGSGGGSGGGGGGAGGMALILYTTLTANSGTINTAGGAGGAGNNGTSASGITGGGAGGAASLTTNGGAGSNGGSSPSAGTAGTSSSGGGGGGGAQGGTGGAGGAGGTSVGGLVVANKYFA